MFSESRYIWISKLPSRNQFALFRLDFVFNDDADSLVLHIFADSRYRLRINGMFVYTGPARFHTRFPEYDSIDVIECVKKGKNTVTIEVNYFGASSFQTDSIGLPGFIADSKETPFDFSTPGNWKCLKLDAWSDTSPLYSFAQNPLEICDTRKLPESMFKPEGEAQYNWETPRLLTPEESPWGPLRPTTARRLSYTENQIEKIHLAAPISRANRYYSYKIPEAFMGRPKSIRKDLYRAFSTWIHAETDTEIELGASWGDYWLNNTPIHKVDSKVKGNQAEVPLALRKGWNHLTGINPFLPQGEFWSVLFEIPREFQLKATPDESEVDAFYLSSVIPKTEHDIEALNTSNFSDDWTKNSGSIVQATPALLNAWIDPVMTKSNKSSLLEENQPEAGEDYVWTLEMEEGFLGHVHFEIDSPEGTIWDIGYHDWKKENGLVDFYRTNPFVNSCERYIASGGKQVITGFHSRGGIFMHVSCRVPERHHGKKAKLNRVKILETKTIRSVVGNFACPDELMNKLWKAAIETLIVSTEDQYSDSPWRERGSYVGDCLVNLHLHKLIETDLGTARRVIKVFAESQNDRGMLSSVAPSNLKNAHNDFTSIWILLLDLYVSITGDAGLLEECYTVMKNIYTSDFFKRDSDGLISAQKEMSLFIDWGVVKDERVGAGNLLLNLYRIGSMKAAGVLADRIGRKADAALFRREAQELSDKVTTLLWNSEEMRFNSSLDNHKTTALHGNILAARFGVYTKEQYPHLISYIKKQMKKNYDLGRSQGQGSGHIELYFFVYLIPVLVESGDYDMVYDLVCEHYENIIEGDNKTLPECFSRYDAGVGSRCHSWAGYPAVFLTEYVLGIRMHKKQRNVFMFDPKIERVASASGTYPHPNGPINVNWTRNSSGEIEAYIEVPEGVTIVKPTDV